MTPKPPSEKPLQPDEQALQSLTPHGERRRIGTQYQGQSSWDLTATTPRELKRAIYGCTKAIALIVDEGTLPRDAREDLLVTLDRIVTLTEALENKCS